LGSAAGAAVFIRPLIAEAQTGQTPKRIFIHHYPCGTVAGINGFGLNNGTYAKWYWRPPNGSSGPSYTASPLLKLFDPVRASCLSIHGLIRGDRTQKIAGDKHTHGILYMTTGWVPIPMVNAMPELDAANAKQITAKTATIDQQLLAKFPQIFRDPLVAGGRQTQFPSIQLAASPYSAMTSSSYTCLKVISYADHDKPMGAEARTQTAFNNIFGSAIMPGIDPLVFQRQQAQKKSILDFVQSDIQRLQPMVPVSQRPKLDAQLSSIRNLEAQISSMPPAAGTIVKPTLTTEPTGAYELRARQVHDNMLDIIRCAFQSDLTRVATFSSGHGNNSDQVANYFSPTPFMFRGDGHGCSHNGKTNDAMLAKGEVSALFLSAAAKFLTNMSKIPEATGTLLDNTFNLIYTECEDGDPHSEWYPMLVAGGKWLKINTGQHMVVTPDRYVNDFWISMQNALAATVGGAPISTWGDPQYAKGALPGVFA